jgi:hypothetical protein
MNSGGSGDWRSRGRRDAMPKPVSQTRPVAESTSTLAGFDVLVDQPASVELTKCARQGHCESEKCPISMGWRTRRSSGSPSCVIDHEHRLSALAHQFQRPQCPRTVQVLPKFEFVREAIDALKGRMLSVGRDGYERVPTAVSIIPRQSAEGTSRISPQHLYESFSQPAPNKTDAFICPASRCTVQNVTLCCVRGNATLRRR